LQTKHISLPTERTQQAMTQQQSTLQMDIGQRQYLTNMAELLKQKTMM